MPTATEYFKMAAAIDLADNMGNAAAGLHMATMGGLWQAAVMGFCRHPCAAARRCASTRTCRRPGSGCACRCASAARACTSTCAAARAGDEVGITMEKAPVTLLLDGEEREFRPGTYRLRRPDGEAWQVGAE